MGVILERKDLEGQGRLLVHAETSQENWTYSEIKAKWGTEAADKWSSGEFIVAAFTVRVKARIGAPELFTVGWSQRVVLIDAEPEDVEDGKTTIDFPWEELRKQALQMSYMTLNELEQNLP